MKIRFGEFPEDHHFLLIMRPFTEWMFKFFGWLVVISTVQFAEARTGSSALFLVKWFLYVLLLGFIGCFVDWILSFKIYKVISGKKIIEVSMAEAKSKADVKLAIKSKEKMIWLGRKIRSVVIIMVSLFFTIVFVGAANLATSQVISSLLEFQQKSK